MSDKNSSKIRSFFKKNGYYFAKSVFSAGEIQCMEKDFDQALAQLLNTENDLNARWGGELMKQLDEGESVLYHTHNIQSFSAVWLSAFMKPKFLDIDWTMAYRQWRLRRARRKFEVYMKKRGDDGPDRWVN